MHRGSSAQARDDEVSEALAVMGIALSAAQLAYDRLRSAYPDLEMPSDPRGGDHDVGYERHPPG